MKRALQLLLVLAVIGLGSILSLKIPFISHLTGSPEFCGSCHIMDPWVDTFQASSHSEHTDCAGCHIPHEFITGSFYKAFTGTRDAVAMILGTAPDRIEISGHGSKVVNDNCLDCHTQVMEVVGYPKNDRGQDCYDCHQNIPHSRYWYIQKESE